MKEQIKNIFKCVLFLLILLCSLTAINKVLVPKYILKNSTWPTTSSYRQFYKMEPNSIDVLFFGSSVCVNAFIPQEIYNDYGIRSYNLGSEQQSIFLSYYSELLLSITRMSMKSRLICILQMQIW